MKFDLHCPPPELVIHMRRTRPLSRRFKRSLRQLMKVVPESQHRSVISAIVRSHYFMLARRFTKSVNFAEAYR